MTEHVSQGDERRIVVESRLTDVARVQTLAEWTDDERAQRAWVIDRAIACSKSIHTADVAADVISIADALLAYINAQDAGL